MLPYKKGMDRQGDSYIPPILQVFIIFFLEGGGGLYAEAGRVPNFHQLGDFIHLQKGIIFVSY